MGGVREQTSKHTDLLTDRLMLLSMDVSHNHTITTTSRNGFNLMSSLEIEVIKRIVAIIVNFFSVPRRTVGRIRKFFILKPTAPQGKSSLDISSLRSAVLEEIKNKQTYTH